MLKVTGKYCCVWVILCVGLCSCARHFYDVAWQGIVIDSKTGLPIPFCEIQTTCLSQNNMDQSDKITRQTRTDIFGKFDFHFDKGYRISSQLSAYGYEPIDFSSSLLPGNLPKVLKLNRIAGASNSRLDVRVLSQCPTSEKAPFMGVRFLVVDSQKIEFVNRIGFDLLNGKKSCSIDSVDVWIEISKDGQKNPIVCANPNGGLFAVHAAFDSMGGRLLNGDYAPVDGYHPNYLYTGSENGLFVKCRDGIHFAKIFFDDYLCVLQYGEEKHQYKELGLRFSYVVQRDVSQPRFFPSMLVSELTTPNVLPALHSQIDEE